MPESNSHEFLIEEYKTARDRISKDIEELDRKEIFYITFIAAIYAFIFQFAITDRTFLLILAGLSVAVSCYGIVRYNAHRSVIQLYEEYIKNHIEPHLLAGKQVGLATYYDKNKNSELKYARYILLLSIFLFTSLFLLFVILDPAYIQVIVKAPKPLGE